jgi:hypothetical protein
MPAVLQWTGLLVVSAGIGLFSVAVGVIVFGVGMVVFGVAAEREAVNNGAGKASTRT